MGIKPGGSKRHEKRKKRKRLGYLKDEANVEKMLPLHCLLVERRIVIPAEQTQQEKKSTDGRSSTMQGHGQTKPNRHYETRYNKHEPSILCGGHRRATRDQKDAAVESVD